MNTSGEESKYGVEPAACTPLAKHIQEKCAHLRFAGLMTIGQPDYSSRPENFQACILPDQLVVEESSPVQTVCMQGCVYQAE